MERADIVSWAALGPRAPLPRNLLDALELAGVDVAEIARRAGTSLDELCTGVTLDIADQFACLAYSTIDDPAFGIAAGALLKAERFGLLGFVAMMSPTLAVAFHAFGRFSSLAWGDPCRVGHSRYGMTVSFAPLIADRNYARCKLDIELVAMVAFARRFTRQAINPLGASVSSERPPWFRRYETALRCPIAFGAAEDSVTFSACDVDRILVSSNPVLLTSLETAAEEKLARQARIAAFS